MFLLGRKSHTGRQCALPRAMKIPPHFDRQRFFLSFMRPLLQKIIPNRTWSCIPNSFESPSNDELGPRGLPVLFFSVPQDCAIGFIRFLIVLNQAELMSSDTASPPAWGPPYSLWLPVHRLFLPWCHAVSSFCVFGDVYGPLTEVRHNSYFG